MRERFPISASLVTAISTGTEGARLAHHLGEALHHAGAGGDVAGSWPSNSMTRNICWVRKSARGITLALIPTDTPGVQCRDVVIFRSIPHFQNGPTTGKDVFIPMDYIIGGTHAHRPGLAHVDGMPGSGTLDLAACQCHGRCQIGSPHQRCILVACANNSMCRSASSKAWKKRWRASAAICM